MILQRFLVSSALFFALMISMGCSHTMVAREYPIDPKLLPEFTSDKPIALINAQDNATEALVGAYMGHKYVGDLRQYTDITIATMQTELNKKHIRISNEAEKVLRITVTEVKIQVGTWGFGCDARVKVETGGGFNKEFLGQGGSGIVHTVVNSALNEAVVKILNDDSIIAYLKR